ncbi:MAG TPA: TraR/DksA family transcriptional regulator [Terriglobales bacterium]|nr:TraR/DksA family transcriptional regulator [Terriglobales bacterium]
MDRTMLEQLAEQLRRRRAELLGKVQSTEDDLDEIRNDDSPELEDQAQNETIYLTLNGLGESDKLEIEQIDAALQRIIDGEYGNCARCGEEIAPARLQAVPATPFCVECAAAEEADNPAAQRARQI